eukprot:2745333-Prymnesium_polylepis.1
MILHAVHAPSSREVTRHNPFVAPRPGHKDAIYWARHAGGLHSGGVHWRRGQKPGSRKPKAAPRFGTDSVAVTSHYYDGRCGSWKGRSMPGLCLYRLIMGGDGIDLQARVRLTCRHVAQSYRAIPRHK